MTEYFQAQAIFFFGNGKADGSNELKPLVGGKGASLAEMTRAGLNVPPGFTISAECCQQYYGRGRQWPEGLREEIRRGMAWLEQQSGLHFGRGDNPLLVAVRSGAAESMPGMMDTVLNVGLNAEDPYEVLFDAVEEVFKSWESERAVAYRMHHQIEGLLGTAVNVQMMCPSEVSGVLFTAHPVDPDRNQMILESWYGLGEAVVLGKVTPDRFVIARESGRIIEKEIQENRSEPSLNDSQVLELVELGRRVEKYFGYPCDIEWGLAGGKFYLLQARAIKRKKKTANAEELERMRLEEIARLQKMAAAGGTVWSRFNLYEILSQPTPLTWSIVQKLMSGRGGFGLMYRDLGFDPDPSLDEIGIFDLVCGRPYCNLSREPKLYYRQLPFEHSLEALKKDPQRALYPQARYNPARGGWKFWLLLPFIFFKLFRAGLKLKGISRTFVPHFREKILPAYLQEIQQESKTVWNQLNTETLLERLNYWIQRTLVDFARESLKPTALAENVQSNLIRTLATLYARQSGSGQTKAIPEAMDKAQALVRQLVMGVRPDPEADLPGAIRELSFGHLDHSAFLEKFGHRGHQEMELAHPRWSEAPEELDRLIGPKHQAEKEESEAHGQTSPFTEFQLPEIQRAALEKELQSLKTFLSLRETAKHHLMRGYALIRRILLELDQRYRFNGGIFYLALEELPGLLKGEDFTQRIEPRKRQHRWLLQLPVPPVIFSDDLDAIGRTAQPVSTSNSFQGIPLSAGSVEGPALVLHELPETIPDTEPFILVCPSTDPAWMPLFVQARAVVMETGGMLSHGAIVAREFGLPAVAGLPNIHHLIKTGQRLHVDGSSGKVNILE